MTDSDMEKYLGDYVHKNGKIQETITHRKKKGRGIVAEIMSYCWMKYHWASTESKRD